MISWEVCLSVCPGNLPGSRLSCACTVQGSLCLSKWPLLALAVRLRAVGGEYT